MTDIQSNASRPAIDASRYTVNVATKTSRIFMIVALIALVALIFAPAIVSRSMLQDMILVFLLAALALCWNLMAGYAGLISVGQQAFVGLGGYALFALIILGGVDPLLAIPTAALVVALLSVPVGTLVFRMQGAYFAVVTWVVAEVFRLVLAQWRELGGGTGTSLPRSATGNMFGMDFVAELFGVRSAAAREIIIYWAALFTIALVVAGSYYLLRSRIGLALRAIKDGEVAAQSVGVTTTRIKFAVYVFAAFGAGLVGAIYFLQASRISPDAAFSLLDWTAYIIFIVVIGGLATIEGPIIGAILFVLLRNAMSGFGPWYLLVLGALGIAVMLLAPKGIWGNFSLRTGIHLFPTRRTLFIADKEDRSK